MVVRRWKIIITLKFLEYQVQIKLSHNRSLILNTYLLMRLLNQLSKLFNFYRFNIYFENIDSLQRIQSYLYLVKKFYFPGKSSGSEQIMNA